MTLLQVLGLILLLIYFQNFPSVIYLLDLKFSQWWTTYCLYVQGWRVSQAGSDQNKACWLCRLFFFPE
jgi:hypothetical protein